MDAGRFKLKKEIALRKHIASTEKERALQQERRIMKAKSNDRAAYAYNLCKTLTLKKAGELMGVSGARASQMKEKAIRLNLLEKRLAVKYKGDAYKDFKSHYDEVMNDL